MTPDEIREFGKQNKLPKNVIYKMLEKYHYMKFYKYLKKILEDDKITDKEIDDLSINEAPEYSKGTMVLAFGRFNPPTIGHEKLLRKVSQTLGDFKHVYLSKSQDSTKNPLTPTQKLQYMKSMFPQHRTMFRIPSSNMILDIVTDIFNSGFSNINFIAGSDRVSEFQKLADKYNGKDYNYKSIKLVSSGERDPDAEGVSGMSASKMREMAKNNDYRNFKSGVPNLSASDSKALFTAVKKGMGIKEGIESFTNFLNNDLREEYHQERIFNVGDMVEHMDGTVGMIVRRGSNYVSMEGDDGYIKKAWLYDIQMSEEQPEKKKKMNKEDYEDKVEGRVKVNLLDRLEKEMDMNEYNEIGTDEYAQHTMKMTPGQPIQNFRRSTDKITDKDLDKFKNEGGTIDKYKKRFKEDWKTELDKAVERMKEQL